MNADYHIHTSYSDDSNYEMAQVVKDAIAIGLDEICFCDHVDYGIKSDHHNLQPHEKINYVLNVDYPKYFAQIDQLQVAHQAQITIKKGLEFGIQTHTIPLYRALFNQYPLDFVIMSCHQVNNQEFWTQDFQRDRSQQEYNEAYYREILDVITNYKDYSILGHLDLIRRYDRAGVYPFERVENLITAILNQVIKDGKGIEINTSSFRYGFDDLMPSSKILSLYRQLGGKIITLGSDSHYHDHLAQNFDQAKARLKELGFEYYCTFEKMKPIFHLL